MGSVLVTGGAGFIGSHIVEKLVEKGYDVIVVDDLSRGKVENLKKIYESVTFVRGSILDYNLMQDLISKSDIIFHLAALSRVIPSIKNPKDCFESNVVGTEIISRLCVKFNKKLIFTSSREVYGDAKYIPVDENHPLNPKNPYGTSKVCGEMIIKTYKKCYGLDFVILRLTNVYGERDFDRVIPIFIERALKGLDLIVYGGNQVLDFVYIDDVVDAILKSMDVSGEVLNIGSGEGTTIKELAVLIKKLVNNDINIIYKERRKEEVDKFVADISKAKKVLKWKPKINLREGLIKLVKYLQK